MIDMLKRHEIQVLRRADHTWNEIATLSGVSVRTARRVAAEDAVTTVDNAAERARRQVGRPSKAEAYRDVLVQALTEDPTLRSVELLHRARLAGYTGGQERGVCAGADAARRARSRRWSGSRACPASFRSTTSARCGSRIRMAPRRRCTSLRRGLKYSRWVEVTLVPDERVETLVRALVEHLAAFGGIPLVAVFDRPKTIALKWGRDGVVTEWNPTFAGVALDLGIGVEVCWPYRPQEKGEDSYCTSYVA